MSQRSFAVIFILLWAFVPIAGAHALVEVRIASPTVGQGQAVEVTIGSSSPLTQLRLYFRNRPWPLYRVQSGWLTFLGTDPTTPPGRHALVVQATTSKGEQITVRRTLTVTRVSFPTRRLTFDPAKQPLLSPELAEKERRRVQAALRTLALEPLWAGPFLVPVPGKVLSPYGVLSIYQGQIWGFHRGVDLAAASGTPVKAANHGIVRLAETLPLGGNAVLLDHGLGVVTSYLHLSEIHVSVGQVVKKGEVIGSVGSTGLATGPHLHWGLRVNGVHVDPLPWVRLG